MKRLSLLIALFAASHAVQAECTRDNLAGDYSALATVTSADPLFGGLPQFLSARVTLRSGGGFVVPYARVSVGGGRIEGTGGGSWFVTDNCTGAMNITLRIDGQVVGTARIDFTVGGSVEQPTFSGVYTGNEDPESGTFTMVRIAE
jgi:hypothetical protein